ncbi:MAG: P-II family nitrogen regulator [Planctomycetia bacterium]|nr:P-II family nitrogen regulator [Planctomycetia bacterium]
MKLIIAYIQPEMLNDVKQALLKEDIAKMSVMNALGCGHQMGYTESYRGVVTQVNLLKKVRLEIAVNDEYLPKALDAIITTARSGNIGDGKIFVMDLAQCIRIRTGETGQDAIG